MKATLKTIFNPRFFRILVLGFSSGLPFLLTGGTLKIWLARENVDISTIGFFSWVGISYSLKFLWAPLLDYFTLSKAGRRKSWMMFTQIVLIFLIFVLGSLDPKESLEMMALVASLVALFSATQDAAIDAYRREYLRDEEQGLGSSVSIYGYRLAMLISGGIGIGLVGSSWISLSWHQLYYFVGTLMGIGLLTTFFSPEPTAVAVPRTGLWRAVVDPFKEFLTRENAFQLLLFVFLFKLGDALSAALLNPFYVQMGYTNEDIGLIAKTFGLASSLLGLFIGGVIIYAWGIYRSLWFFGILQALSTAGFSIITWTGPERWALAAAVIFEDVSAGMGSAAFLAFLATLTNKKYSATQYAILSSLAGLGRNFFSGFSGEMVKSLGWAWFFYTCALVAIPGLFMLYLLRPQKNQSSTSLS